MKWLVLWLVIALVVSIFLHVRKHPSERLFLSAQALGAVVRDSIIERYWSGKDGFPFSGRLPRSGGPCNAAPLVKQEVRPTFPPQPPNFAQKPA